MSRRSDVRIPPGPAWNRTGSPRSRRAAVLFAALLVLPLSLAACKGGAKKPEDKTPGATDSPAAPSATTPEANAKAGSPDAPALPSIGDDPSPAKICARLAAAAAAEGGEGEAKWKELAPDCEKNLAERMSSSTDKYTAFADCMRDKTTFTAVMHDCRQLE